MKITHNKLSFPVIQRCRAIAGTVLPDGGPLDDDWPDYHDKVGEALSEAFPNIFNGENDDYDFINWLIESAM